MRHDLKLHLIGGLGLLAYGALLWWVATTYGLGQTLAAATTIGAAGVELYQKARGEGTPAWDDALVSAVPGWAAWAVLAALP